MKKICYTLLLVLTFQIISAQTKYEIINSTILNEERQIKIQLPRSYDTNTNKKYPIFIVFDGDYLFEPVAGVVDYYSYWEDIPESIVVGINQFNKREDDCNYSPQNSLPIDSGADFFEFVGKELVPFINKNYRTENFRVAVGHGSTANFINYFLLRENPLFKSYIVLSPDFAPDMKSYISERLSAIQTKTFYYLATSNNDVGSIKKETVALNNALTAQENKNVLNGFDNFEGPSHYTLPAHALPKALESTFLVFQPISKKEYKETILKLETSPVDYLTEKYQTIEELFGIEKQILINDFKAIAAAIKKKEKWDYFEALGKLARKEYPDTLLGSYYLARFYEETGEPKKAMKTYQSAYILEEIGGITKDHVLEKAEEIKADFGY